MVCGGRTDLAFQIIQKEEDLMDSFDREGISPLHVLAEKPTAFRSGIHFSLLNKIMYHCKIPPTNRKTWGWIESSACIICYLVSYISIKAIKFWQFPLLIKLEGIFVEELVPGAPKAKKNIFQELQKMIKLPGGTESFRRIFFFLWLPVHFLNAATIIHCQGS